MQLKKHIKKQSVASQIRRIQETLNYNPLDESAQQRLEELKNTNRPVDKSFNFVSYLD